MEFEKEEIEKEIFNLDLNKASQNSNIPIKIVKKNVDIFCDFVCTSFNDFVKRQNFLEILNLKILSFHSRNIKKILKETTDQ